MRRICCIHTVNLTRLTETNSTKSIKQIFLFFIYELYEKPSYKKKIDYKLTVIKCKYSIYYEERLTKKK